MSGGFGGVAVCCPLRPGPDNLVESILSMLGHMHAGHVFALVANQICPFERNMATDGDVVAFVRQQLAQFGVRGLSEAELEDYASGTCSD